MKNPGFHKFNRISRFVKHSLAIIVALSIVLCMLSNVCLLHVNAASIYTITITVKDQYSGEFLTGASVEINNTTQLTDASGQAIFDDFDNGDYNFTVTYDGYEEYNSIITVSNSDASADALIMSVTGSVTFTVTDQSSSESISNANVTVNGSTKQTDQNGNVDFENLQNGTYDYSVTANGYDMQSGSLNVNGADITENISMLPISASTIAIKDEADKIVSGTTINLNVGDTIALWSDAALSDPLNGQSVGWESSDASIATLSSANTDCGDDSAMTTVTAVCGGSVQITATEGSVIDTITLEISIPTPSDVLLQKPNGSSYTAGAWTNGLKFTDGSPIAGLTLVFSDDGSTYADASGGYSTEGNHNLTFEYKDAKGAFSAPTTQENVKIDTTSPTIDSIEYKDDNDDWCSALLNDLTLGAFFNHSIEVEISASDDVGGSGLDQIWYQECSSGDNVGSDWVEVTPDGSGKVIFNITSEFKGTVYAEAVDKAGNVGNSEKTGTLCADATAPDLTVSAENADGSSLSDGEWTNQDVTISLSSTSLSGVKNYEYTDSMGSSGSWQIIAGNTLNISEAGIHDLQFKAVNNAGSEGDPVNFEVEIEKVPPAPVTVTAKYQDGSEYSKGDWTNQAITLTFSSDSLSHIKYFEYTDSTATNPDAWQNVDGGVLTISSEGRHNLQVRGVSKAGNTSTPVNFVVNNDQTPPSIDSITYETVDNGWLSATLNDLTFHLFFNKEVQVKITASDTGSGVKQIWYQTSATAPSYAVNDTDTAWTKVTPDTSGSCVFTINPQFKGVVYAEATDEVDNKSESQYATFCVDSESPSDVTVSAQNGDGTTYLSGDWTNQNVTLMFSSTALSDINEYQYKDSVGQNSGEWQTVSNGMLTLIDEGQHHLQIKAISNATNESNVTEFDVNIDKTEPIVSISGASPGSYNNSNKNIEVSVDELNYQNNNVDIKVTKTLDGNTSTYNFGQWQSTGETSSLSSTFSQDGTYTVTADSTDAAGNQAVEETLTFTVDKTAPVISVSGADNNYYYNIDKSITVSVDESNYQNNKVDISVKCTLDGVSTSYSFGQWVNSSKTSSLSDTLTQEGTYVITVTSVDAAGNTAVEQSLTFTIDKTAPVIAVSGANQGSYYNIDKAITISVVDSNYQNNVVSITASRTLDGVTTPYDFGQWVNTAKATNLSNTVSQEGTYTITATSTDAAGNKALQQTLTFTIDKTAPVISVSGADANSFQNIDKTINVSVIDSNYQTNNVNIAVNKTLDGVTTELDFGQWQNTAKTSSLSSTFSQDGTYSVTVNSTDAAGNVAAEQTLTFTVDKTAPVTTISGAMPNSYSNVNQTITVSAVDSNYQNNKVNITVNKTLDGVTSILNFGQWQNTAKTSSMSSTFSQDGTYTVTVNSTDAAGNIAVEQKLTFTIDKTAPVIAISGATKNSYSNVSRTITVSVVDSNYQNNSVNITVSKVLGGVTTENDFGLWSNTAKTSKLSSTFSQDGTYTVKVDSTDAAGNRAIQKELTFTIDKTKPVIAISGVQNGHCYAAAELIDVSVLEQYFSNNNVSIKVTQKLLDGKVQNDYFGNWVNFAENSALSKSFDSDGIYTITAFSHDAAGNSAENKALTFTIDESKPVIGSSVTQDNQPLSGIVTAGGLFKVNDLVDCSLTYILDGDTPVSPTTVIQPGKHTIKFVAEDVVGHLSEKYISFVVSRPTTAATIKAGTPTKAKSTGKAEIIRQLMITAIALILICSACVLLISLRKKKKKEAD